MADANPQGLTLELLVLRCQLGDVAAFGKLAEQYDAPARYYVRRLLGTSDAVDDVVQETWLAVARKLPSLRNPEAFPAWFYRIARNKAVERIRRNQGSVVTCCEDVEELVKPFDDEPFSPEDVAAVHAALNTLSPAHCEVLVLRFMEDMSYDQIAQVVGCGLGTVRSRLFHAKRALKNEMEKR